MEGIVALDGVLCSLCGEKLFGQHHFSGDSGPLCGICRRMAPPFHRAVAFGAYDGGLRELIHLLKYQQIRPAARVLAGFIAQSISGLELSHHLLVIPVPLWPGRRQERGFNQAEEIARCFVRSRGPATSIQLDTTSLVRKRETASQTGLSRHQRRANMRGAFAVVAADRVRGRSVLLVDDVMTTGTTAGECARVLLRAGAKEVFVATVARATKEVAGLSTLAAAASAGGTQGHA